MRLNPAVNGSWQKYPNISVMASNGGKVVELLTHYPTYKGSNQGTAGTGREKIEEEHIKHDESYVKVYTEVAQW